MKSKKGRKRNVLPLLIFLLFFLSIFSFSLYPTKANDANTISIPFASGPGPFTMPGGYQWSMYGGTWYTINNTGMEYFSGGQYAPLGDKGEGSFVPQSDITNFTFTLLFMHKKNTYFTGADELLATIGRYYGFAYLPRLVIHIPHADTDSPYLEFQVIGGDGSQKADAVGLIQNNVWYNLQITYCANLHVYYAYINGKTWGWGNWTWGTPDFWLQSGTHYDFILGAWHTGSIGLWENFFDGYIQSVYLTDQYTSPFTATKIILHYQFDQNSGTTVIDTSGNNFNGQADLVHYQWLSTGKFGYCLGGSNPASGYTYGAQVPDSVPLVLDKYSSSFYFYPASVLSGGFGGYIVQMKQYNLYVTLGGTGSHTIQFVFYVKIGGAERTLTSGFYAGLYQQWDYIYTRYDGATLVCTVICQNGTVAYNGTQVISGTMSSESVSGFLHYGLLPSQPSTMAVLSTKIDEFKLVHDYLSPYDMNNTGFGASLNGTKTTHFTNGTNWISAIITPSTIVCNPTTDYPYGIGYATLLINCSGAWTVKLADNASMFNYVNMYPSMVNIARTGYSVTSATINLRIPLTFTANNLTTPGQVISNAITFSLTDNLFTVATAPFTIQIGERNVIPIINQSSFACYWSNAPGSSFPVNLYWNTAISGKDILYARDKTSGLSVAVNVQSLKIDEIPYNARGYNSTFVRYMVITPDSYGYSYTFNYGIDSNVATYGNFTVTQTLKVTNKNNPNDFLYAYNLIYVYINANKVTARHIWCVVTPSSITDYGNVTDKATLYLYANYQTKLFWSLTGEAGSGWETWYIHVYGSPAEGAVVSVNSSVALQVVLPSAIGPHNCTLTVHDFNDPNWTNYTTLTVNVNPPIPGIDFSFYISPLNVYFDMSKTVGTPHLTGQLYCTNTHDFYLSIASTTQPPNGMSVSYPTHLGQTSSSSPSIGPIDISFNVNPSSIANGDYAIEFDAYYVASDGSKPFMPQVVKVYVINAHPTIVTPAIVPNGTIIIQPTVTVPVEGYGSGGFASFLAAVATPLGWSIYAVGFLIGGIIFMLIVLTGAAVAHQAPAVVHVGIMIFALGLNVMLGLWPMWIAWALIFTSAALLGWKVVSTFGGEKGHGE